MQSQKVYINDITEANILSEIKKGLEFVRCDTILDENSTVFIKPNLTDSYHRPGITTTPTMINAIIRTLSPLVKTVIVGESDGGNYSFSANVALKNHLAYATARNFQNVKVVNLSALPRTRITENVLGKKIWIDLPTLLVNDVDCLISVPVLKTHAMTQGSFSIKNLWGCYPDPMRLLYHKNLSRKLALINKILKNNLQIVDGFWALDGHGPMEGTPVATNKVLISNNPVAVDSVAAFLMSLDKRSIDHIEVAERFGLGTSDLQTITTNKNIEGELLSAFVPCKVKLDYFSWLLFRSELLSKLVLSSPITPSIYRFLNFFRSEEAKTYWSHYNKMRLDDSRGKE